jgi:hypothetical protein
MEINKIQAIVDNKAQWQIWEEYLLELRQQIQQELEVATSVQVMHQCQGKLALVRKLLNLPEAIKRSKE